MMLTVARTYGRSVRRLRLIALACLVLTTSGCAARLVAADRNELSRLKDGPPIAVVHRPADFFVMIPASATPVAGQFIYMATAKDVGKKMIADYGLRDPAVRAREGLLSALTTGLDVKAFDVAAEPVSDDGVDALRARFPNRVVLAFQTALWSLQPSKGLLFSDHYRVFYGMQARLVRTDDGKVLWQGLCGTGRDEAADRPWPDLNANAGVLLKARLEEIGDACAALLRAQMLGSETATMVK